MLDLVEAEQSRANMMLLYERGFSDFTPAGLCEIHRFLFGDIYDWAGEYRIINIEKREKLLAGRSVWYSNDEDIVLLETMKSADRGHRVFKLQFAAGEFDMVIYDEKENCCEIFEIKHSDKQVPAQYRHLVDQEKCDKTEQRFGPVRRRYVLYRGEDATLENGVQYRNVESYLKNLPELNIAPVQEAGIQ